MSHILLTDELHALNKRVTELRSIVTSLTLLEACTSLAYSHYEQSNNFQTLDSLKDTLYQYVGYLKESDFFYSIHEYGKTQGSMQKVYLIDNGLFEVRRDRGSDSGKLLENMIFIKLQKVGNEISYYSDGKSKIDFVTRDKTVQACHLLTQGNLKREITGFEQFEQKNGTGRTRSLVVMEKEEIPDGISTDYYDYMLNNS